jgi:hypothetical protein
MQMNIYNQCSDLELVYQTYFSAGLALNGNPVQEIDASSMAIVGFRPSLTVFEGVLAYTLRRKHVRSSEQFESTHILLFVI